MLYRFIVYIFNIVEDLYLCVKFMFLLILIGGSKVGYLIIRLLLNYYLEWEYFLVDKMKFWYLLWYFKIY